MRKSELTPKQLQYRSMVVNMLTDAGWNGTASNKMFDDGYYVNFEAIMEIKSKTMSLEVMYYAKDHSISISFSSHSGKNLMLIVYFEDKLQQVLETIVSFQNTISSRNYRKYVRLLLQICPSTTYAALGQERDRIVLLTDDSSDLDL